LLKCTYAALSCLSSFSFHHFSAYFQRWWDQQTAERQAQFKTLVDNKQVEFILGGKFLLVSCALLTSAGWCMNDEAVTHYEAEINQMTVGHEFLLRTLGVVPKIAWHIGMWDAIHSLWWLAVVYSESIRLFVRLHSVSVCRSVWCVCCYARAVVDGRF